MRRGAAVAAVAAVMALPAATAAAAVPSPPRSLAGPSNSVPSNSGPSPAVSLAGFSSGDALQIVGVASTPDGGGFWEVNALGQVEAEGDAAFYGQLSTDVGLNEPIVGVAATPDGGGYWLVASDGGVFAFGDARFFGSTGGLALNEPIVGVAATPDGGGYWLVASDGGVFAFGDATFFGSTGDLDLQAPIVGMTAASGGNGYWLLGADGGVFTFGDAPYFGSESATGAAPFAGMAVGASSQGYWLVDADGSAANYGDAPAVDLPTPGPLPVVGPRPAGLPVVATALFNEATTFAYEPASIQASGDAGNILYELHWTSWTARTAVAHGTVDVLGCVPNCAEGSRTPTPVTLQLDQPYDGIFTQLTENIAGEAPEVFALPTVGMVA